MDSRTLAIPVAFILLAAVLCLLLIGSKWRWWQKLALIVIVPAFGLAVWNALGSYKGWPTTAGLPRKAVIIWAVVREPEPGGDPGAIYLWLQPFGERTGVVGNPLDYVAQSGEPRAYVLPYSRSLHKNAEKARTLIREGRPVVIDFDRHGGPQGGEGAGGTDGPNDYGVDPGREDPQVYDLPPPQPPQKLPE